MKLSGRELLRTLDDYFSAGNLDTEMFFLLLFPALLLIIFLFIFNRESSGNKDPFATISEKDMDFVETVRQQKGLEEFDRDFLLNLALNYSIRPVYQIFIDAEIFSSVEKELTREILDKNEDPAGNKSLKHMKHLHKKLF
jgi:hypothetical protein